MSSQSPPPLHQAPPRGWWQRNWKWSVPTLCLLALTAFGGVMFLLLSLVGSAVKSSGPYQEVLAMTRTNTAVERALGSPIEDGFLMSGSVSISGASGEASLAMPVSGPKGKGTIYVESTRSAGVWDYSTLVLQVHATGERINLLEHDGESAGEAADAPAAMAP